MPGHVSALRFDDDEDDRSFGGAAAAADGPAPEEVEKAASEVGV